MKLTATGIITAIILLIINLNMDDDRLHIASAVIMALMVAVVFHRFGKKRKDKTNTNN